MTVNLANPAINRISIATESHPLQTALFAAVLSILLHTWFALTYHSGPVEPLHSKPPQVIEVALVVPPPPPPPEVKPKIEPLQKVIPPPPKKPEKPKEKPLPKPKPPAPPKVEVPRPLVKAPPKVMQKTFVEAVPDVEDHPEAKITAPIVAPPPVHPAKDTATPGPTVAKPSIAKSEHDGEGHSNKPSSGVVVLERVKPHYPSRALSRHIEGSVTIKFTVTSGGDVSDAQVVSSTPEDIFDEAALDALKQWRFKQKIVNGVAVEQRAVQTLRFTLTND